MSAPKLDRKQQILQVLATELEQRTGSRITTAALARAVGVSEAALYRHFASKAKMYEALIGFAEDSVFGLLNRILEEEPDMRLRCEKILRLLLGFSERNPGITRLLLGDALVGENERLRVRVGQFFERLETQLKQVIRTGMLGGDLREKGNATALARLMLALVEGRMNQYVRSDFRLKPTEFWGVQWHTLATGAFLSD